MSSQGSLRDREKARELDHSKIDTLNLPSYVFHRNCSYLIQERQALLLHPRKEDLLQDLKSKNESLQTDQERE